MLEEEESEPGHRIGRRRTQQREVIREIILRFGRPLSVDQIFEAAVSRCPGLGKTTVYRTIKLLHESGAIRRFALSDGVARYEAAGLDHHDHFKCRLCKVVFDFEPCLFSLPAGVHLPSGFVVESHSITLHGLCPECEAHEH